MSTCIDVHVLLCQYLKAYPVVLSSDDDILDVIIVFVINQCSEVITIDWKSLSTLNRCDTSHLFYIFAVMPCLEPVQFYYFT
jgi:hypothetical protein